MKNFFLLFAVVCALAACNKETELGPEYKTPAQITNVSFPAVIQEKEEAPVTATLTSEYRLGQAFIYYWLNDDVQKAKEVSVQTYTQTPVFEVIYAGKIPAQPVGTKVSFQVACMTFYYVPSATEVYSYTVQEAPVPLE